MASKKEIEKIKPPRIKLIVEKEELLKKQKSVPTWLKIILIFLFITLFVEIFYLLIG